MDTEKNTIEELIEKMDQESKEFILLKKMDEFLISLKKEFTLNEEQETIVDGEMTLCLLKQSTLSDLRNYLEQHLSFTMTPELKHALIEKVYAFLKDDSGTANETAVLQTKGVISNISTQLNHPFTTPTTLAPTKRVYTELPSGSGTTKPLSETIPALTKIDPYRELPEDKK